MSKGLDRPSDSPHERHRHEHRRSALGLTEKLSGVSGAAHGSLVGWRRLADSEQTNNLEHDERIGVRPWLAAERYAMAAGSIR